MDNVLQTWFHLLLLVSAVCTTWLHFWVDKKYRTQNWIKSHLHGAFDVYLHHCSRRETVSDLSIISQPRGLPDWHITTTPDSTDKSLLPRTCLDTSPSWLFWSPLGFNTHNLYGNCGVQFKPMETVGQAVLQYSLGSFWNMHTKAHIHFSLEGTGP